MGMFLWETKYIRLFGYKAFNINKVTVLIQSRFSLRKSSKEALHYIYSWSKNRKLIWWSIYHTINKYSVNWPYNSWNVCDTCECGGEFWRRWYYFDSQETRLTCTASANPERTDTVNIHLGCSEALHFHKTLRTNSKRIC